MLMDVGEAPSVSKSDVSIGITGMRILKPLKSSGFAIGPRLEVVCRKPLSHILGKACRPALSILPRRYPPNAPSIAAQTAS